MANKTVRVPDIGDFKDVLIIDVLVKPGDRVAREDPLVTLESDKATMDIPAPWEGRIEEVLVKSGDTVAEGSAIAAISTTDGPGKTTVAAGATPRGDADLHAEVLVLGGGPGGYTAAFRASDLGKSTVLVERYPVLGGVCLNVGCIPSKALLHAAKTIADARRGAGFGVHFGEPTIDLQRLRAWKQSVVTRLTTGLADLAKRRHVMIVNGTGRFDNAHRLVVTDADGAERLITFDHAIVATGSQATWPAIFPRNEPRVFHATGALALASIPRRLLVVGGGVIGLEMATIYHALGSEISIVELQDSLIPGTDADLVRPLAKRIAGQYENVWLGTRVNAVLPREQDLLVALEGSKAPAQMEFDQILVSVGRQPNSRAMGLDRAGVAVSEHGFVTVDGQQRSNIHHIFAIGDIVGQPMLAHKAAHEGKVAAEVAAGLKSAFDNRVIPNVAYTDPEVAFVGLSETQAKAQGIDYGKGLFPWAASGRSLSLDRDEGLTKLLFDPNSRRVLGAGIVGPNAGDLIAEAALAIEMGSDASDLGLTIHPHPTLSETVGLAAEAFEGTITDLYSPRKRRS